VGGLGAGEGTPAAVFASANDPAGWDAGCEYDMHKGRGDRTKRHTICF